MLRRALPPLLLTAFAAHPLAAQATGDEARLTFTVGLGYSFGRDLWSVPRQPYFLGNAVDTFAVSRRIREAITANLSATYFRSAALGFTADIALVGLGTTTSCTDASSGGTLDTHDVCAAFDGVNRGGASVLISGGPVLRAASRGALSPYVQATGGVLIGSASTVETSAFVTTPTIPTSLVRLYSDTRSTDVSLGAVLAAGVVAQAGHGYQIRLEVRDNIAGVRRVTGATAQDGDQPGVERTYKHVPSIMVGFGVILERRRGRRY